MPVVVIVVVVVVAEAEVEVVTVGEVMKSRSFTKIEH